MKIAAVYSRGVQVVESDRTLYQAANEMSRQGVSALGVLEGGRLAGIISERDITRAVAEASDPKSTWVSQYMTRELISADPDDDAATVALQMLENSVRHLPVMVKGEAVGMVSARDLLTFQGIPASAATVAPGSQP